MKLVYNPIDAVLTFEETTVYLVILESPTLMRQFIEDLDMQLSLDAGSFVLSEKQKTLQLSRYAEFIFNPISVEINQKRLLSKVYQQIEKNAVGEEMYLRTQEVRQSIHAYMQDLMMTVDCPLDYNLDFSVGKLLSPIGVQFAAEGTALSRLVQYIDLCNQLLGIEVVFIYQMSSLFTREEIILFCEDMAYRKIAIVFIEASLPESVTYNKILIVDNDLCIVRWED